MLAECLESLQGLADEIVVVDTGSLDASAFEIARAYGAEILHMQWQDDFSAARNVGLDRLRGQWVLYIDADERVRPLARERLESRLADDRVLGLRVLLRPVLGSTPYYEYRLWRNDPRIRFRGVMHERVVDTIHVIAARDGLQVEDWPELELDHVGYEGDQLHKHVRNLPLLEQQLRLEPDNVFNWRHLYRVLSALGREAEAESPSSAQSRSPGRSSPRPSTEVSPGLTSRVCVTSAAPTSPSCWPKRGRAGRSSGCCGSSRDWSHWRGTVSPTPKPAFER